MELSILNRGGGDGLGDGVSGGSEDGGGVYGCDEGGGSVGIHRNPRLIN